MGGKCREICPTIYAPVCANNGESFNNICEFKAQKKCRNDKTLKLVKKGRCSENPKGKMFKYIVL